MTGNDYGEDVGFAATCVAIALALACACAAWETFTDWRERDR
jgi:hypothetical protein